MSPSNNPKKSKNRTRSTSKENKKRKSTSVVSDSGSLQRGQLKKKPKLKDKDKDKKIRTRSKSLDKEEKKTLEKMHNHVSKLTKVSSDPSSKLAQSNAELKLSNSKGTLKDNLNFNQKSMTKLSTENLDNKLLKDSKISAKFSKHLANSSINSKSNSNYPNQTSKSSKTTNEESKKLDLDESIARKELGDEIMNSIDNYFSKNLF